jgi:hypothetical protein
MTPESWTNTTITGLRATTILIGVTAALALAACGGSSSGGANGTATRTADAPTDTGASASTSPRITTTGTTGAKPGASATAYRKCLEAHGAGLPRLVPGPGGSVALGHIEPPKGVSQATFKAAAKACGGATRVDNRANEARFIACMRTNGVNVPTPRKGVGALAALGSIRNPHDLEVLKKCGPLLSGGAAAR